MVSGTSRNVSLKASSFSLSSSEITETFEIIEEEVKAADDAMDRKEFINLLIVSLESISVLYSTSPLIVSSSSHM